VRHHRNRRPAGGFRCGFFDRRDGEFSTRVVYPGYSDLPETPISDLCRLSLRPSSGKKSRLTNVQNRYEAGLLSEESIPSATWSHGQQAEPGKIQSRNPN
jgi:hypothetical protein